MAAEQVRGMSDEDLARHAEGTVIMLEAIKAEYDRRNAVKAGKPDTPRKPVGRA